MPRPSPRARLTSINAPGGEAGIIKLADLLGRDPKPLSEAHGEVKPKMLAVIDEATCIGCTLCIQACPVDAILGAAKQLHTVIASECTGCELCVAPCPVDCITMEPIKQNVREWTWSFPSRRMRHTYRPRARTGDPAFVEIQWRRPSAGP